MAAETEKTYGRERREPERGALERAPSIGGARRAEQHERQRQPGGHLDPDARHERHRRRAEARGGAGRERQRAREGEQDQRVVVGAADGEHEQHRVQADEGRRPAPRLPETTGGTRDQRDGAEAGEHGQGLERPQPARDAERHEGVADQREQGAVGRVLVGPTEESEDFVARGLRGDVRVGVQAVQGTEPREADVAEDVLRDQRGSEQQDHVGGEDRRPDRAERKRAGGEEHAQVAGAHDQAERLKAARADAHAEPFERAGQPPDPAAAARGHVLRRLAGSARGRQEGRHDDPEQAERPERPPPALRAAMCGLCAAARRVARGLARRAGRCRSDRHRLIVTAGPRAGVCSGM